MICVKRELCIIFLLTVSFLCGCADMHQETAAETLGDRDFTDAYQFDQEEEYAKLAWQVGFDSNLSKYAFAEPDIADFEEVFFSHETMAFEENNPLFTEGKSGEVFAYATIPNDDNSTTINGILLYDEYGTPFRICPVPTCDAESVCVHMNLYGNLWDYYNGSLYFLCEKIIDGDFVGCYLLEYDIEDGEFYKTVDIPCPAGRKLTISDGYAYIWCGGMMANKNFKKGESCLTVVDLDGNRACNLFLDVSDVRGIVDGRILVRAADTYTFSAVLIDPNTREKETAAVCHDGSYFDIVPGGIVYLEGTELRLCDLDADYEKIIADKVIQYSVTDGIIWYWGNNKNLSKYDMAEEKNKLIAKNVSKFLARGDICLYTYAQENPDILPIKYTEVERFFNELSGEYHYQSIVQTTGGWSRNDIYVYENGKSKLLYAAKSDEIIGNMYSHNTYISEKFVFIRPLIYTEEIRTFLEYKIYLVPIGGAKEKVIGTIHGGGKYYLYDNEHPK